MAASKKKKKSTSVSNKTKTLTKKEKEQRKNQRRAVANVAMVIVGLFLTFVPYITDDAVLWRVIRNSMFGVFGVLAYVLGPAIASCGIINSSGKLKTPYGWRLILPAIAFSATSYVFSYARPTGNTLGEKLTDLYNLGVIREGSGVVSAVLGYPIDLYLGDVGGKILVVLLDIAAVLLVTNTTPAQAIKLLVSPFVKLIGWVKRIADEAETRNEEKRERDAERASDSETTVYSQTSTSEADNRRTADSSAADRRQRANAGGPAADVIKDVMSREAELQEENDRLFARFSPGSSSYEAKCAAKYFDKLNDELVKAGKENGAETEKGTAKNTTSTIVDDNVAALAKKADAEYLKNANATAVAQQTMRRRRAYQLPPLTLLAAQKRGDDKRMEDELRRNAQRLVATLKSFGVNTKVVDISRGPSVTRYELQPEVGVRLSRITQLTDDIALNMAAASVRIEPVPGKTVVGIELPNEVVQTVGIKSVIESEEFQKGKGSLLFAIGKDVSGAVKIGDIEKMPHMLIAGATGMGKSVCINSMIVSLLYKYSPAELKLILVDPKMVEFGCYNGLPHLFLPVVTDPKKAAGALGWAVVEMMRRYQLFSENGCRNIKDYNEKAADKEEKLPRVVIIIDELADLMMVAPNEVESAIARLAQMARAAGMHLILSTQRPSVDVITGVIKNNIPSRIALAVSSQVDSRTILDGAGAEKLLGKGDMLYMPIGNTKSTRIQGCFVSNEEVEKVVEYIKLHNGEETEYDAEVMEGIDKVMSMQQQSKGKTGFQIDSGDETQERALDVLFDKAVDLAFSKGTISGSMLCAVLGVGSNRAARLINQMEEQGVIMPKDGTKPRQLRMTRQEWLAKTTSQGE